MADATSNPPSSRGRGRQLWVGLFVLVGLISGLAVMFTMTDPAMFRGRYIVSTIVENAGGIRKGDPVQMAGVVIGRVLAFRIDHRTGKVEMRLEIEADYSIPADSKVEIRSKSVFGEMVADVLPGSAGTMLRGGDTIPGSLEAGLLAEGGAIADKAGAVMDRAKTLLSDETIKNVGEGAKEMRTLLADLNAVVVEQRGELLALTRSLRKSASGIEGAATRPELETAIKKADTAMTRLDEATASLGKASDSFETVMARIEKGEGTLGKLTKDDALYRNLDEAVQNANKLMVDIREHPRKYVKLSLF